MIGWWEASWGNVIVTGVIGLVVLVLIWAGLEELYRGQAPAPRDDWDVRELTGKDGKP